MLLKKNFVFADNMYELNSFLSHEERPSDFEIVLTSSNFSLNDQQGLLKKYNFRFYDEYLENEDLVFCHDMINGSLYKWFYSNKEDVGKIGEFSFGLTFAPSLEILLTSYFKYYSVISKLFKNDSIIYIASNVNDVIQDVIDCFNQERVGQFIIYENKIKEKEIRHEGILKIDPDGRFRDLSPFFNIGRKEKIINSLKQVIGKILSLKKKKTTEVFFMNAGKMDSFFDYLSSGSSVFREELTYSIPFEVSRLKKDCKKQNNIKYYKINVADEKLKSEKLKSQIAEYLENNISKLDFYFIKRACSRYFFPMLPQVLGYYESFKKLFKVNKPKLVIVGTDVYETHLICAMAARSQGVPVWMLPHGLYIWGSVENKKGQNKLFDGAFCYGKKDYYDFLQQGISEERLIVTGFPYFNSLKQKTKRTRSDKGKKQALILTHDYYNISPGDKIGNKFDYLTRIIRVLEELDIEIKGIKARGNYLFENMKLKDKVLLSGQSYNLYAGYTNFLEIVEDCDLVIGPLSSAFVEASLLGIDYFPFWDLQSTSYIDSINWGIKQFVHISMTDDELKKNIRTHQIFKRGHSIEDIIYGSEEVDVYKAHVNFEQKLREAF